jgi:hypothetical protein
MTKKSLPVYLVVLLACLLGASQAGAIMECVDCSCGVSCSASCITYLGGWSTCGAQGYLCSGHPSCGGGCLTSSDAGFLRDILRGEPRRATAEDQLRGEVTARLTWRLAQHVEESGLGTLYAGGTAFQLPGKSRSQTPALAFVGSERRTGAARSVTPDLVVEFLSAPGSDFALNDWLQAGTRAVLSIDARERTVTVYRNRTDVRVLGEHELLELPDLLPGWSLRVGDLFQ